MASLKSYLNAFAQKVGQPTLSGYVSYGLPTVESETATQTYTAPFDGFAQVCGWFVKNVCVINRSVGQSDYTFSSGTVWGSTGVLDERAWIPVRKGDTVEIRIGFESGYTPNGKVMFFKRMGAS